MLVYTRPLAHNAKRLLTTLLSPRKTLWGLRALVLSKQASRDGVKAESHHSTMMPVSRAAVVRLPSELHRLGALSNFHNDDKDSEEDAPLEDDQMNVNEDQKSKELFRAVSSGNDGAVQALIQIGLKRLVQQRRRLSFPSVAVTVRDFAQAIRLGWRPGRQGRGSFSHWNDSRSRLYFKIYPRWPSPSQQPISYHILFIKIQSTSVCAMEANLVLVLACRSIDCL